MSERLGAIHSDEPSAEALEAIDRQFERLLPIASEVTYSRALTISDSNGNMGPVQITASECSIRGADSPMTAESLSVLLPHGNDPHIALYGMTLTKDYGGQWHLTFDGNYLGNHRDLVAPIAKNDSHLPRGARLLLGFGLDTLDAQPDGADTAVTALPKMTDGMFDMLKQYVAIDLAEHKVPTRYMLRHSVPYPNHEIAYVSSHGVLPLADGSRVPAPTHRQTSVDIPGDFDYTRIQSGIGTVQGIFRDLRNNSAQRDTAITTARALRVAAALQSIVH